MSSTETNITSVATTFPLDWSLADLCRHLGDVPLERIRLHPQPGTATVADVIAAEEEENRLCELVDGVLVEKTKGSFESIVACQLSYFIHHFLREHPIGVVLGTDGMLQFAPPLVRMPDVSFIRWDSFPDRKLPEDVVYGMGPDLAVEVISRGNSRREMQKKLAEYFHVGTRLVWYIDARKRSAVCYRADGTSESIDSEGYLEGHDVLPGFKLKLGELFRQAEGPPRQS